MKTNKFWWFIVASSAPSGRLVPMIGSALINNGLNTGANLVGETEAGQLPGE